MRNVVFLINEARENTNTQDREAITNQLCVTLLNRCLDYVCSYLHNKNVRSRIFRKNFDLTLNPNTIEVDLPHDVYAENSIINVSYQSTENPSNKLRRIFIPFIADKNMGNRFGYTVYRNKLILNPYPYSFRELSIAYEARPPRFGLRYGQIQSVNPDSVVLEDGFLDMSRVDEFFCVVDSLGVIKEKSIKLNQVGNTLYFVDTSNISVGDYVVPGKYSTTHVDMPIDLEQCFVSGLENLINARLASKLFPISDAISSTLLDSISDVFADPSEDEFVPPVMEYGEWIR